MQGKSGAEAGAGREAASKERRRARIVQAATELLDERGAEGFSVDEVAARAGVSRRTVFNHFGSIDHLVVAVGTEMLRGLIDSLRLGPTAGTGAGGDGAARQGPAVGTGASGDGAARQGPAAGTGAGGDDTGRQSPTAVEARADAFAELVHVLRSVDLVTPMIRLTKALGGVNPKGPGAAAVVQEAMARVVGQLAGELCRRHPDADPLAVELTVAGMIGGVVVIYEHWAAQTGLADTPESRRVWSGLVEVLVEQTGRGPWGEG